MAMPGEPIPDSHVVDQHGNLYRFKDDAFQDPFESPLERVGRRRWQKEESEQTLVSKERLQKGLSRCRSASCRVTVPGFTTYEKKKLHAAYHVGSGTAIDQDRRYVYVITAGHVVGNKRKVLLEFYRGKYQTTPIYGEVVWTKWTPTFTCLLYTSPSPRD